MMTHCHPFLTKELLWQHYFVQWHLEPRTEGAFWIAGQTISLLMHSTVCIHTQNSNERVTYKFCMICWWFVVTNLVVVWSSGMHLSFSPQKDWYRHHCRWHHQSSLSPLLRYWSSPIPIQRGNKYFDKMPPQEKTTHSLVGREIGANKTHQRIIPCILPL